MTVMTSWDLFDDLRSAQDELLRMNWAHAHRANPLAQSIDGGLTTQAWAPPVDISEREDAYMVTVELPGVGLDDLEISFQDGLLTIQGERHLSTDSAGEKIHRAERRYGAFRRSITLPSHVKADAIEASAQDGVLHILLPKVQEAQAKRIHVRAGKSKPALAATAVKNGA